MHEEERRHVCAVVYHGFHPTFPNSSPPGTHFAVRVNAHIRAKNPHTLLWLAAVTLVLSLCCRVPVARRPLKVHFSHASHAMPFALLTYLLVCAKSIQPPCLIVLFSCGPPWSGRGHAVAHLVSPSCFPILYTCSQVKMRHAQPCTTWGVHSPSRSSGRGLQIVSWRPSTNTSSSSPWRSR